MIVRGGCGYVEYGDQQQSISIAILLVPWEMNENISKAEGD